MQAADAFLHMPMGPYGVVVLEAMSSGCPDASDHTTMAALDRIRAGRMELSFPR